MHNVVFVKLFERLQKLSKDNEGLMLFQKLSFLKKVLNCPIVAVLINKVEIVGCFESLYKSDNILML